jgi:hypothetical protein
MGFFDAVLSVATGGASNAVESIYNAVTNGANDESAWLDVATGGVYNTAKGYEEYAKTGDVGDIWEGWKTGLMHGANNPIANGANAFGTSYGTQPQYILNQAGLMDDDTYEKNKKYTELLAHTVGMAAIGGTASWGAGGAGSGGSAGSVPYGSWTGQGGEAAAAAKGGLTYGSPEYLAAAADLGVNAELGIADYLASMPAWAKWGANVAGDTVKKTAVDTVLNLVKNGMMGSPQQYMPSNEKGFNALNYGQIPTTNLSIPEVEQAQQAMAQAQQSPGTVGAFSEQDPNDGRFKYLRDYINDITGKPDYLKGYSDYIA